MRLNGKVAIVTGAARGIGQAVALRSGQEGAKVAVVDLREDEGCATARHIEAGGGQAMFIRTDVSDSVPVQAMVDTVVQQWDTIDILVNNAGVCPMSDFDRISETVNCLSPASTGLS